MSDEKLRGLLTASRDRLRELGTCMMDAALLDRIDEALAAEPVRARDESVPPPGFHWVDDERFWVAQGDSRHTLRSAWMFYDHHHGYAPGPDAARAHHLAWNGTEWVDARCGCRYHPDDDNGSHGGAPHVHRCKAHEGGGPSGEAVARARQALERLRDVGMMGDGGYAAQALALLIGGSNG